MPSLKSFKCKTRVSAKCESHIRSTQSWTDDTHLAPWRKERVVIFIVTLYKIDWICICYRIIHELPRGTMCSIVSFLDYCARVDIIIELPHKWLQKLRKYLSTHDCYCRLQWVDFMQACFVSIGFSSWTVQSPWVDNVFDSISLKPVPCVLICRRCTDSKRCEIWGVAAFDEAGQSSITNHVVTFYLFRFDVTSYHTLSI